MPTYYIQCVDQDENGNNPFWNGKLKSWVPSFHDASRYTQKQRENYGDLPERGVWVLMPCNPVLFRLEYERRLKAELKKDPNEFWYGLEELPAVVWAIIQDLKEEQARITPTIKAVARSLGLEPKPSVLGSFLRSGGEEERTPGNLSFGDRDHFATASAHRQTA